MRVEVSNSKARAAGSRGEGLPERFRLPTEGNSIYVHYIYVSHKGVTVTVGSSDHKRAVWLHIISQHHNTSKSFPLISVAPNSSEGCLSGICFLGVKNGPLSNRREGFSVFLLLFLHTTNCGLNLPRPAYRASIKTPMSPPLLRWFRFSEQWELFLTAPTIVQKSAAD